MEILKDKYSITELSQILGVTDHTLRYYEKEFNLAVPKDNRGRRCYTTELANIMYQIKTMRNDGLEIKAIRKILQSEEILSEPTLDSISNEGTRDLTVYSAGAEDNNLATLEEFFNSFKDQITTALSVEINNSREAIHQEICKSKLELGACIENGMRKMESKMEKHFQDVDAALCNWRQKNRKGFLRFFR